MNNLKQRAKAWLDKLDDLGGSTCAIEQEAYTLLQELIDAPAPSVPDGLPLLISGAIYDFAGFLTTQEKTIQVGARVDASAVVDMLKEWAALRGLKLDDAAVLSWQEWLSPTPPEPPADVARDAEPVAYVTGVYGGHTTVAPIDAAQVLRVGMTLYTAPPAPSVPPVRSTGQWESSRIADYNRGWNDCREATEKALNGEAKVKVTQTYYMKDADGEYFVAQPQPTLRDTDDTMSVAERVVRIVLAKAKGVCLSKVHAIDHAGNSYLREASATQCANAIGALNIQPLIEQVQGILSLPTQPEPHPDDIAVDRFAAAMKAKMARSRDCGRYGWDDPAVCSAEDLRLFLVNHIAKGDPVDVGNFAMMLFNRNETTAQRLPEPPADVARDAERYRWLLKQAWFQQAADRFDLPDGGLQNRFEKCTDEFIDAAIERQGGES